MHLTEAARKLVMTTPLNSACISTTARNWLIFLVVPGLLWQIFIQCFPFTSKNLSIEHFCPNDNITLQIIHQYVSLNNFTQD